MKFEEVYSEYEKLRNNLSSRRTAIIKRNLEEIGRLDEELIVISEKIKAFDLKNNNFTEKEKESLKTLASEVKNLEENNEILINYSLNVINNTLSGILNIIQKDKTSYNSKGLNCQNEDENAISSIIEEA